MINTQSIQPYILPYYTDAGDSWHTACHASGYIIWILHDYLMKPGLMNTVSTDSILLNCHSDLLVLAVIFLVRRLEGRRRMR